MTADVKSGGKWSGWLTSGSGKNSSIAYFNYSVDKIIMDAEGNSCGIIFIPSIEITFENDYIHVLHNPPKHTYTDT